MADIITTLHPENDNETNLYPNIKKENIPSEAINRSKLDSNINSLLNNIGELHPSGVATSTVILAKTSDEGVWVGSDTGNWYYWNGTQYVSGGTYLADTSYDEIKRIIYTRIMSNNLMSTEVGVLYPVYLKSGDKITISTSDGSTFDGTIQILFYNSNRVKIDYYTLTNGLTKRTLTIGDNVIVYYLGWNKNCSVPLMVNFGDTNETYSVYELEPKQRFENDDYYKDNSKEFYEFKYNKYMLGSWVSSGELTTSETNRARTYEYLKVKKGEYVHFENVPDNVVCALFPFNLNHVNTGIDWNRNVILASDDMYVLPMFKHSDDSTISITELNNVKVVIVSQYKYSYDRIELNNNLVGLEYDKYYPVVIPPNTTLTFSTESGLAISGDLRLLFLDENLNDLSSGGWNFKNLSKRTFTVSNSGKNAYYLKWFDEPQVNVQLELGINNSEYKKYTGNYTGTCYQVLQQSNINNMINTFISGETTIDTSTFVSKVSNEIVDVENAEIFMFFTDPHMTNQSGLNEMNRLTYNFINCMEKIYNSTPCSFIICGGDWLGSGAVKSVAVEQLTYIDGFMRKKFVDYLPILGNHDTNYQGKLTPESENYTGRLSLQCNINCWQRFKDNGKAYYKYKAPTSDIYVFDTGIDDNGALDSYKNEQINWFASSLLSNNVEHIIMSMHIIYPYDAQGGGPDISIIDNLANKLLEVADAFNNRTTITHNLITYDFTNCSGKVEFCLAGHTHADYNAVIHNIPVILTDKTMRSDDYPTFDICIADWDNSVLKLIRMGNGSDRNINI